MAGVHLVTDGSFILPSSLSTGVAQRCCSAYKASFDQRHNCIIHLQILLIYVPNGHLRVTLMVVSVNRNTEEEIGPPKLKASHM